MHVHVITDDNVLTDEQLNTFIVNIEKIMNNKSLRSASNNPFNLHTQSPRANLLGRLDVPQAPEVGIGTDGYRR